MQNIPPRLGIELRAKGSQHSSLYVQDGTYLRLNQLNRIQNTPPKKIINNIGVQNLRILLYLAPIYLLYQAWTLVWILKCQV